VTTGTGSDAGDLDETMRGVRGGPELLAAAADELRRGLSAPEVQGKVPTEYVRYGTARLLDALAASVRNGDQVHHAVLSAANEMARHVMTHLVPLLHGDGPESGDN
jgi:hypothetical protein